MRFVRGSHRHGKIPHVRSRPEERNVLGLTVNQPESWGSGSSDGAQVVTVSPLRAGQASLHSDLLLHGSGANRSATRRRCALALTYHTPDVRFNLAGEPDAAPADFWGFVCRGCDPSGYWPPQPEPPTGEDIPKKRSRVVARSPQPSRL